MQSPLALLAVLAAVFVPARAFHDCIQPTLGRRLPPNTKAPAGNCSGGLCLGMHNGPHEGGTAAYPVGDAETGFTVVQSTFTVPELPAKLDGITYYIWTDIFFGDVSNGRMNQFVPQLLLGSGLDSSSGPPNYEPIWGSHFNWTFGAHYFFETFNATSGRVDAHAAYGELFPAAVGEELFIRFQPSASDGGITWTLTMGAVADPSRTSTVVAEKPYMGLGVDWEVPTKSWAESNYSNLCINSCWEMYGARDRAHLPGNGSHYTLRVERGAKQVYPWVTKWDQDEGLGTSCAVSKSIKESHNDTVQSVAWEVFI